MLVSVVDVRDHQAQQQRSEAIAAVATWRAEGPDRGQWAALRHKAAEAMLVPKLEPELFINFVKIPFLDPKRAKLDQKSEIGHVRTCQDLFY